MEAVTSRPPSVTDAELTEYIIRRLGRHVARADLIFEICQVTGLPWDKAEKYVQQVEDQHRRKIALSQSPLLLIFGVATLIGGIFLVVTSSLYFISLAQSGEFDVSAIQRSYRTLLSLVTGFGMVFGSLFGLWQILRGIIA